MLVDFYKKKNIKKMEGYSQEVAGEVDFLKKIVKSRGVVNVMEIGFNAGHSAEIFLSSNTKCKLWSFDIGRWSYVNLGKEFIDENFPNRHRLILGNSLITIPKFPTQKFDLIFIDGGHAYNVSKSDIENCKRLSHKETIIVMDDTMNNPEWEKSWNKGVNKAWRESIDEGLIVQNGFEDYGKGRGLSWGRYK